MQFSKALPYLIFTVTYALLSCSAPKELVYRDYKNFSIEKLGFGKSQVKLDIEYYNPNNFGLQLRRTDLDIHINDNYLGHSTSDSLIQIPRKANFLVPVKFDVDMQNVLKNAWSTMWGKEVTVKVTGKVKVGKANVFMSYAVNYTGKHTFSLF